MTDKKAEEPTIDEDERWEYFFNYLTKSMKLKFDKWTKMMSIDEYRNLYYSFVDKPEIMSIMFTIPPSGVLTPFKIYPKNVKSKCCYFLKKQPIKLTNTNIKTMLLFGDISPKPLDELQILLEELFIPMLTNPENCKGWPSVVTQDIERQLHEFKSTIMHIKGAMLDQILLPMPTGAERSVEAEHAIRESRGEFTDLELKSEIEKTVIKWSSIVNTVMKEKSTMGLAEGELPVPMREVNFWSKRLRTLESIYEQLCDPRVKRMSSILEISESVYYPCYQILFRNIVAAVAEARDINTYLKPIAKHFIMLESNDFSECRPHLRPIIHCVCLLWANSRYFCLSSKITLLIREIGNSIVKECTKELDPSSIFQAESEEQVKRLAVIIDNLKYFVAVFEEYRTKVKTFFPRNVQPVPWSFHPRTVFDYLFAFIARLEKIYIFFETVIEFGRLEKVEIGGIKGRGLSVRVQNILGEFTKLNIYFTGISYDPLDPTSTLFDVDYEKFLKNVQDLDRKLAALFSQAYDECFNIESIFKLLKIIGNLLFRPIIYEEVAPKLKNIPKLVHAELDMTKMIFDAGENSGIPMDRLMPPVTGALYWIYKLKGRIDLPMMNFNELEVDIAKDAEADYIRLKYKQMTKLLTEKENQVFKEWVTRVPEEIRIGLNEPLLKRVDEKIFVNFSYELDTALHEVKHLLLMEKENIPKAALELFERDEELYKYRIILMRIVEWYNLLQTKCNEVELEMISDELKLIDSMVDRIIETLTWNDNVLSSIEELYDKLKDLKDRILQAQANIQNILDDIREYGKEFMYDRKDGKLLDLEGVPVARQIRFDKLKESFAQLTVAMELNYNLYFNIRDELEDGEEEEEEEEDKVEEEEEVEDEEKIRAEMEKKLFRERAWKNYEIHIDKLLEELMLFVCRTSLDIFVLNMNPNVDVYPLLEVLLELKEPNIHFKPSIDIEENGNFIARIEDLIADITHQSIIGTRVNKDSHDPNFMDFVEQDEKYSNNITETINKTFSALEKVHEHSEIFKPYAYLWTDDKEEILKEFLKYSRSLTHEEKVALEMNIPIEIEERTPNIDDFRKKIDFYEETYNNADQLPYEIIVDNWLLFNLRPIKQALLNHIRKWGNTFKDYIVYYVTSSLDELEKFINEAVAELNKPVSEDDYDQLVRIIEYLNKIKDRREKTDGLFKPIKEYIALLKTCEVKFNDDVYNQLEELPDKWTALKKLAKTVKQSIADLHAKQCTLINRRAVLFNIRQKQFLDRFFKTPFFDYNCTDPYQYLDKCNEECNTYERLLKKITSQAHLFEVVLNEYPEIQRIRRLLPLLKSCWDYITIAKSRIDEWKETLWAKIDVEGMETDCKKMAKELRAFDKETRSWNIVLQLESDLKNLLTALRALTELQNPAIRDRHWAELQAVTKVKIEITPETTLENLLDLELHKFEEEVKNIVDKATKEQTMEKALAEINNNWQITDLSFEYVDRVKANVLRPSEEIVELLEDNQVQIQNMVTSKYVGYFYDEVVDIQRKLSTADQVLAIWFEVQRKWGYLESIFVGSDDIRHQLPMESQKFDTVDRTFRNDLLAYVNKTPNVIQATNLPGLYEKLEALFKDLVICEKALNNYLETKRLAYPRFYFVSSADLLDILSNGNAPELVQRHLSKLYDSMAKLNFSPTNKKIGIGMYSKDGEYVDFKGTLSCTGKVEVWLNALTDVMRLSIIHVLRNALYAYEEKPRDQWIFDWPAQPALVVTQICWASEVNQAFHQIEEGQENAMKDFSRKQVLQLNALIDLLLSDLSEGDRQKIMTICTIDVHSRDVVTKIINDRVDSVTAFQWQSQLRHRWDENKFACFVNICDAQFQYDCEYLGNTPRLVITPLTDRCYITLTQSLRLIMGGAPAGPAGTGKTETTKDLGKAVGIQVYVFNCSEQMDYKSCGNMWKGLAQTGAWGCFDEFNRISVEVLSVVAVQVKTVLDAIKAKKKTFYFMDNTIKLIPTIGMFITMNPGYAGRTELPENLKALFRPCAMVVPDFALICEIMLIAEGFQGARLLSQKFITLYTLCRELLSKQDHYDWGLRAIKSVLVVAGSLKRGDRERPEDQVLMRALRDFNIPKIVTEDVPVFMGLIGDLFPALDVPRKRELDFEEHIKKAAIDLHLQPEDGFILKIVQLKELFAVRHSVFIVGFAGTGKTEVWKTLFKTYQNLKLKPVYNDLNPKSVTNDELFGIINPATREWKDGLISVLMREQSQLTGPGPKWLVLDGDIDPMWIESLNTVMDDNKVLTLASNERIALTKQMRLLFEISNLRTATPATVSRAGILYINPADLGWNPYVASWIETRKSATEKSLLVVLFDKYVNSCLEQLNTKLKKITPVPRCAHIQMLCFLLECLLTPQNVPNECPREWYEIYFVFACIWAFGSVMFQDQIIDWRNEFHKWWIVEFKTIKFPPQHTVFDYYVDPETKKFLPWSERVTDFVFDPDIPLSATLVDTAETSRYSFFIDMLLEIKKPIMLIGTAGTGKSVIIADKLAGLPDNYITCNVPFNFYTTSAMLQQILEKPLVKKAGRNYGPPGTKTLIYFIDDLNIPEVDTYGTVQPHSLIRQHMDYNHWYDRVKIQLKEIHNVQYIASMNPTAGSFTIDSRLQRHFCAFAVSFPTNEALTSIYTQILKQHLEMPVNRYLFSLTKHTDKIVEIALITHTKVAALFLPTAVKFHYAFNIRDLSNIFQGILFTTGDCIKNINDLVRVYLHEANRVYCDKLVDSEDIKQFQKIVSDVIKKTEIEDFDGNFVFSEPLIYCHFAEGIGDMKYMPVKTWKQLNTLLDEALVNYNELIATMNLVLFEDAMYHICRINRIMEAPRGNALLIGVGGSGKQSLTRLAASISSLEVFQIQLRKTYSISDLKVDFATLYMKAGVKIIGTVFLMSDSQVADEKFLVVVNDVLASGEIPELFADDEIENIINSVRNEVKNYGIPDTKENCWKFFIDRVRRTMKVVLCFSPVGSTLRIRGRKFPALVNCTSIDWFHEWPKDALESVSKRFLSELDVLPKDLVESVSLYMSYVHTSVNEMSQIYLRNEKRYNYTTPKSFLEQIALYSSLLTRHIVEVNDRIFRLTNGLDKLATTAGEVAGLKEKLKVQEIELIAKNKAAEELIQIVSSENEKVGKEKEFAAAEEKKVKVIEEDVSRRAKICAEDLRKAEPALIAAQEALNTLNKNNLTELKSFGSPPEAVVNVCAAVMVLMAKGGKIPKDRSWKAAKLMMSKVDDFLKDLVYYDKENISPEVVKAIQPYINDPEFDPEKILSKSTAASGLCAWVINIMKFYDVFVVVEPKRKALQKANQQLQDARNKLVELKNRLEILEDQLSNLKAQFDAAVEAKLECQRQADATTLTIDLANRLVNGLASEKIRWGESVVELQASIITLPGNILQVTAFISYMGCFTRKYRKDLIAKYWNPFLDTLQKPIPKTPDFDPISLLTDDAQIAQWNNEGLPTDNMSTENASILTNSTRWPLMIDPQLQGIKWIKNKYGDSLIVLRLAMKNYLDKLERAIDNGDVVLLENIGETVDAVLDPLLSRLLIKKGKVIKIGDKEIDYNTNFRLILQTKLANPHYKPEMQAQCTLINFTVTRDGLEDQLLGAVVKAERPDLELIRSELTKQNNYFKITLKNCEDNLLSRLFSASENILGDVALVENLETTKKTAAEIIVKVEEAKITTKQIDEAREVYRPAGARASLLYFLLNDLFKINPIYQFSLKAFSVVFLGAIAKSATSENVSQRVSNLVDAITFATFMYASRGLFEKDKLIFLCLITLKVLQANNDCPPNELDFLLRMPIAQVISSPVDFLSTNAWGAVKTLASMDEFAGLDKDIEGSAKRWKKFINSETPEREKFPAEWKTKTPLEQLCMIRAIRPDRVTYAVNVFVEIKMGKKYTEARTVEFAKSFQESSSTTPIFFILSPGVDPTKDVENLGKKLGYTVENNNFHNISLGQGQEEVAESAMEVAASEGQWVILQNIHLVAKWLSSLEKKMEQVQEDANENFRLFMSAEPAPGPEYHILPQGILESSIKITNEPPTGMLANLHKALDSFSQETLEMSTKESEFKAILFSLCYFHACIAERRKFGPQGWNRIYPFNVGDLTISVHVLYNYLETNSKVPWEDLRYLFGEIMYGGHITDDWDRRLCRTYLLEFMQPILVDGEMTFAPGFVAPPSTDYEGYHKYIDDYLPPESPYLYGLHPNAEIGFLTTLGDNLFKLIFELQPRDTDASASTISKEDKIKIVLEDIYDKLPELYNMAELYGKIEDRTPFVIVALQECERMNNLVNEMRTSLKELELGLKGELTITKQMEDLQENLFMDVVPPSWEKLAYPSMLPLGGWFNDLTVRMMELSSWVADFNLPPAVWLAGFFNPQSFLTAIMQQTARKNEWPLDKMCLNCDVTKKQREEFSAPPREGAYICGLIMEGARWDSQMGTITDANLMDLFPVMPVVYIKAVTQDKQDVKNVYECPVYKTRQRGPTFVWTFNLRTKVRASKWILGGVALILQI